jgi:ankyrin repeat protein
MGLALLLFRDIERYSGYHTGRFLLVFSGLGLGLLGIVFSVLIRVADQRRWVWTSRLLTLNLLIAVGVIGYACWPRTPEVLHAVLKRRAWEIKIYSRIGVNLNGRARWGWHFSSEGETPLTKAVERGDMELVRALIDGGADVDKSDGWNDTPIAIAIRRDRLDLMELLYERGSRKRALTTAVGCLNTEAVRWLLAHGEDPKQTCIAWSAIAYDPKFITANRIDESAVRLILEELVKHGADLSCRNAELYTPLTWCAANGRAKSLQWLIESGAQVDQSDGHNRLPIESAARHGDLDCLRMLLAAGASIQPARKGASALHAAFVAGELPAAQALLDAGADIAGEEKNGRSIAISAVLGSERKKSADVLRFALEHGANPRLSDGNSPLLAAISSNNVELAAMLIDAGADPNQTVGAPRLPLTPRHPIIVSAINRGNLEMVKLLVAKGAKIPPKDTWTTAPSEIAKFLYAIEAGSPR